MGLFRCPYQLTCSWLLVCLVAELAMSTCQAQHYSGSDEKSFKKFFNVDRQLQSGSGSGYVQSGSGSGSGSGYSPSYNEGGSTGGGNTGGGYAGGGLISAQGDSKQKDASDCGGSTKFSAYVLVEHSLLDSKDIDDDIFDALEDAFKDTYNKLNAPSTKQSVCDKDMLRYVDDVDVAAKDDIYVQIDGQKLARRNFLYRVEGRCDGCGPDTNLFDIASRRPETTILQIMGHTSSTTCKCMSSPKHIRAPTEVEFRDAFRSNIKAMYAAGTISNIKTSEKVIEYVQEECDWKKSIFETEVEMELTQEPQGQNVDAMEDGFLNTYNRLATAYCDPDYRFVTEVTVQPDLPPAFRERQLKKKKRIFSVKGRCKGCKRNNKLFNDAGDSPTDPPARRHLRKQDNDDDEPQSKAQDQESTNRELFPGVWFDFRHIFDGKDECFCAAHPIGRRAQTEAEFKVSYNQVLAAGNSRGYITQPIGVNLVEEVYDS